MKLAVMLRIVSAMWYVLDKLATLLRGKGSGELLADELLEEVSCITRSAVVQHPVFYDRQATMRLQCRQQTKCPKEKS
jgi:hypothetical protein